MKVSETKLRILKRNVSTLAEKYEESPIEAFFYSWEFLRPLSHFDRYFDFVKKDERYLSYLKKRLNYSQVFGRMVNPGIDKPSNEEWKLAISEMDENEKNFVLFLKDTIKQIENGG